MTSPATPAARVPNENWGALRERRVGVMLHWDASGSDVGAVAYLRWHPACRVSYTVLVLDDGTLERIAPDDARAWHAGSCTPSDPARLPYRDANSAFYGLSFAARPGDVVRREQLEAAVRQVGAWFAGEGWHPREWHRITDHYTETRLPSGSHRKADLGPRGLVYDGAALTLDVFRAEFARCVVSLPPL